MSEHNDGKGGFELSGEPVSTPLPRRREEVRQDAASYVLIEETDFAALTTRSTDGHAFINPRLREAFDCRTNCLIAVPIFTAKGGEAYERETGGTLPGSILADPNVVTFEGQKVLLFTLVFHESPEREAMNGTGPGYEFSQLDQSKFQTLLHALRAEAVKAASGNVVNRRTAIAALVFAALGLGAILAKLHSQSVHSVLREVSPPQAPPPLPPAAPEVQAAPESIRSLPGLAAVLASSLDYFDTSRRTLRDPLLKADAVSEAFLDNRFHYTGQAKKPKEADSPFKDQRIHTFTVIGNRSSYYNAQGQDRFDDTYLNHAINTLLDVKNLSDEQIKEWIVFNYQRAFSVTLEASRIMLTRSSRTQEVSYVTYNPPAGFRNSMRINFARAMEDVSPFKPGGSITTDEKVVPILASDNRLILQSGVSPDHDLQVPENLLELDKTCTRPLGKEGGFGTIEMTATELASAIHRYHQIIDEGLDQSVLPYSSDGRQHQVKLCSPFVDESDPIVRRVARQLLTRNTLAKEATEIFTAFVQGTPYRRENDADHDRPAACTIFNNGSDCNGLVILWSNLATACKLPHALVYFVDKDPQSRKAHVTVGVDGRLAPTPEEQAQANFLLESLGIEPESKPQLVIPGPDRRNSYYNQELTAPGYSPGDNAFDGTMEVIVVEYISFRRDKKGPSIHVSTRGKPKK